MKTTFFILILIVGIFVFWAGSQQSSSMIEFAGGVSMLVGLIGAYYSGKDHKLHKWFRWL